MTKMTKIYIWLILIAIHFAFGVYCMFTVNVLEQMLIFITVIGAPFVPFTYYCIVGMILWIGLNMELDS